MTRRARWMRAARNPVAVGVGVLLGALLAAPVGAVLDGDNKLTVTLKDGTNVVLFGEYQSKIAARGLEDEGAPAPIQHSRPQPVRVGGALDGNGAEALRKELETGAAVQGRAAGPLKYYYLPPGIRLGRRPDGTPEFLFVRYTTDAKEDAGGTQGGLMHMLMEWGLTPEQERDLKARVNAETQGKGVLAGAADLIEGDEKSSFRIISGTLSDQTLTRSLVQSGHAPLLPGGKVAAAANMTANGAQLFLSTVEKARSIADLSVELDFAYDVMLPAARGEIIFDWSKWQNIYERDRTEATVTENDKCVDWTWFWCSDLEDSYTEQHVQELYNTLIQNEVITLKFEGLQPDNKYVGAVLEAMLDFFTESLTSSDEGEDLTLPAGEEEEEGDKGKDARELVDEGYDKVVFDKQKIQNLFASKRKTIYLDAGLAVRRRFTVVGNLASWYNGVKDNRNCVQTVNLNDPFFAHRDIRFILDLEAKELFEELVNYVTINVKKPRTGMPEFNDSVTIDAEYLKNRGIAAAISYARGEDKSSELYMYQTQWSLKGGNIFPANARWIRGNWEGVTLAPPVERWIVEAEGDVEQMAASDIARVSVELHYPLFGKEQWTTIALTPRDGQPIKAQPIFVDRGTRGFAYRTIVHHKTEGRMVVPCVSGVAGRCIDGWRVGIGERYVYANLPEEILVAGDPREKAKQAAKQLGQMGAEKILDQFEELFASAD